LKPYKTLGKPTTDAQMRNGCDKGRKENAVQGATVHRNRRKTCINNGLRQLAEDTMEL
jgi:hypothetical protein